MEEKNQPLASVFERFFAFVIDYAPVLVLLQAGFWVLLNLTGSELNLTAGLGLFFAAHALFVLYEVIFTSGGRRTLGKFLLGIRVVSKNGANLSFFGAFMRVIGYYIGIVLVFIPFSFAFFNAKRRAFHDFLAGSIVVETRPKTAMETTVISALGTLLIGVIVLVMLLQLKNMTPGMQAYLVSSAREQVQKIAYLEEVHYEHYHFYTSDLNRLALISGDPVQFQRDIQRNFRRQGFQIGIDATSQRAQDMGNRRPPNARVKPEMARYQIKAIAKDNKSTLILYP